MDDQARITIVDDEAFSRRFLETVLQDNGYECISLETGEAFWEHLKSNNKPDLVLLGRAAS